MSKTIVKIQLMIKVLSYLKNIGGQFENHITVNFNKLLQKKHNIIICHILLVIVENK